ncbi:MAG: lipopolysaccharide heptosyltransferase I [Deltaproteobacteria bacterium]|nr:lipopolysaccharide heptosyltransferase I [Deltaproteobacteria bacterium]
MSDEHPHILIVKLSSFGDVLHALPTLEALRTTFPTAYLTWLVEAAYAPLLQDHPAGVEVLPAPRLKPGSIIQGGNPRLLARLIHRLRSSQFDLVIDLQGLLKSAIWVGLAKSRRKLGYDRTREGSYRVLTERLAPYDREAHAVLRYLNLAHYLGAPVTPPRFRLALGAGLDISHLLPAETRSRLVVLHPGARWPSKLWPTVAWAQLGDWLSREHGFRVVITGSAADKNLAADIKNQMRQPPLLLAGRTTLPELAAVLRQARFMVTTDTGAMHLAAALETPVVAVFGPTAPWRTGPFGEGHQVVRQDLACSPCFQRRCPEPRCLTELSPEMVRAACEKLLSSAGIN